MENKLVPAQQQHDRNTFFSRFDDLLTRYWIPAGFLIFLTAFFWAPSRHNFKVIVNYALLLPALLAVFTGWRHRNWLLFSLPPPLLIMYLTYMVGMSALRGADAPEFTQQSLYILLFLFALSARMEITPNVLVRLLVAATVVAALAVIYTLIIDLNSGALMEASYRLVGYGTLYNPLKSGHLFGVFVIIGIWCGIVDATLRPWCWLAAGCCLLAVLLTGSRAPCLGLLAVALWNIIGLCRGKQRELALIGLAVASAILTTLFWDKLSERGLSLRPEVWSRSILRWLEHPWLGAGLGTRLEIPMSVGEPLLDTHNVFIAALFYGGVVGLLLFMFAFGASFGLAWRSRRQSPLFPLGAALQLYGISTLQFDGGSLIGRPTIYWTLYWLPMALTLYAAYRPRIQDTSHCSRDTKSHAIQ